MTKFLLAALLTSVATGALAADLPTRKAPPAPVPMYVTPAFTWTGAYIGVNGGWGWTNNSGFPSSTGGVFGGQVGYNYQIGQFVGGVEGDLDWTGMGKSGGTFYGSNKLKTSAMVTDRLRAGVAFDRALIFVTGGYAGIETKGSFNDTVNGISGSESHWRNGGVIGAGIEYAFTNNITAKGEYLYAPFASKTYFPGSIYQTNSKLDVSTIRLGLNYKF